MYKGKVKAIQAAKLNVSKASLFQFDNRLFALSPIANQLYDISDKVNPMLLTSFKLVRDTNGSSNTFLGLVNNKGYFSIGYNIIQVIDFLNESEPVDLGIMNEALIGGRWAFLSDNYLITNLQVLVIYQIVLPSSMTIVYKFEHKVCDFVLINNKLVCATLGDGIKVYDLSQPSSPLMVSFLNLNTVRLVAKDGNNILAEGVDGNIYILDISEPSKITVTTMIKIPGPIASNSIICKDDYLFVRYMRNIAGDTTQAYNIGNIDKPQKISTLNSTGIPLYVANDKLIVLIGIKDWDGVSAISNYTTSLYKIFSIESNSIHHVDDIELEGIWFSSVTLSDNVVYIARPNDISVYRIDY